MSKYIAAIPLSSVSRLSLVEAGGRSMAQVKEALGCQYIINSWFYNMNTGKAVGNLCIDGEVKARANWAGYGLTWDTGPDIRMEIVPGDKAGKTYLSGVELLTPTRGPEEPASYSAEYGGKRGRSAALLAGDYLILYCSGDGTADAATPDAMRATPPACGCWAWTPAAPASAILTAWAKSTAPGGWRGTCASGRR